MEACTELNIEADLAKIDIYTMLELSRKDYNS